MKRSKKLFTLLIFSLLPVALLLYCFYPVFTYDTRLSQHESHRPSESLAPGRILLTDRNSKIITDKAYPNGYYKEIEIDFESDFIEALVFIEDRNFYTHWGVNIPSKLRALFDNMQGKKVSGGSTITEQYIKNKYFTYVQRSYLQKVRESVLAFWLEVRYSKQDILSLYLDTVYFGNQNYGIGAAIEVYFQKEALLELTQEEQVLLISLLHNPGIKSIDEEYFQEYFLQTEQRLGYSFEPRYQGLLPKKENIDRFPHITQRWIEGDFGYPETQVSIDIHLQIYAETILQETINELKGKNVSNGAIYALDPKSGDVLIYVGSKDFHAADIDGQVDVIQAGRQPGSTMKPFLYLLALESGAQSDDLLLDIVSEYDSFQDGKVYVSENYSLKEYGLVRFKKALGNSFNNATVRLARELGLEKVYDYYKEYGFDLPYPAEHYGYSLVLGNPTITLQSLVLSYRKLLDLSNKEKFLLYDILSDPDNRDISFGVNSILNTSIPQAVKTGTSSNFRDNLVVSYHPDFVIGVWVGNNDNSSMQGVTGMSGAGYIWRQTVEKAIELGYIKNSLITPPEGIERISYCLDTRCFQQQIVYASTETEYFSRLRDGYYDMRDIFLYLSEEERERVRNLGFIVK